MVELVRNFITKSRFIFAGVLFALIIAGTGLASLNHPAAASAASCDNANIVYCGLNGSGVNGYISSLQSLYQGGSDHGHQDLKAVFRWAGATNASIAGMNSSNTKVGTMYRNGTVYVGGEKVAQQAWVSARFNGGSGFVHVEGDVYARLTTTSLAESSAPVIVHYDSNGNVDWAVMINCGNAVKLTPYHKPQPPKPTPQLQCLSLTAAKTETDGHHYTFTAKASAAHTTITEYVFDYGNVKETVHSSALQASSQPHRFLTAGRTYSVRATVYSTDFQGGKTSQNCVTTITTPPATTPTLTCDSLVYTETGSPRTYKFVARASANRTAISGYQFHFSDTSQVTSVASDATSAAATHTFSADNTAYSAYVIVTSTNLTTQQTTACSVSLTTPPPNECKPGVPAGSPACNECKPGIPVGDSRCTPAPPETTTTTAQTTSLVNTGPGSVMAVFGVTAVIGGALHQLILRRRFF